MKYLKLKIKDDQVKSKLKKLKGDESYSKLIIKIISELKDFKSKDKEELKYTHVSIALDDEHFLELERIARKNNLSKSELIRNYLLSKAS